MFAISPFFVLALLGAASAHPGEHEQHGTLARREFLDFAQRSVAGCQNHVLARDFEARAIARRASLAEKLRARRGLPVKRDYTAYLNTSHLSNATGLTSSSTGTEIFTGSVSCVLQGEVTVGPYWVKSELIRSDTVETQKGVPFYADFQIINVNTCEPLEGVYLDAWHANSTGVYSGIIASGNGDMNDATNLNNTFLRGVTKTDSDGVGYFETLVPGHYSGRAPHIHILAQINATVLSNKTLSGGHISHVGQAFFDQSLLTEVGAVSPYSTNTQSLTLNSDDSILEEEAASMDPFIKYVLLGDDISDGILGWLSIGIDPTVDYTVTNAATWTADGGVVNADADVGGGGGGDAPSGSAMPSGGPGANATGSVLPANSSASATASSSAAADSSSAAATTSSAVMRIVSATLGMIAVGWTSASLLL